ncbi:IclR family transcriptional regulator [Micrococcaceae sp. AOP34-BR2-30]
MSTTADADAERTSSPVLNLIHVLRCFTVESPEQGVTEIAERVGVHKSTVSRLLATLEKEMIVERVPSSRKYRLGMGLIGIAGPLLASLDVRRLAYPVLSDLSVTTGETAALMIWDGSAAVTVEQVAGPQRVKHTSSMGTRYATMHSASVMALLAYQEPGLARKLCTSGALIGDGAEPSIWPELIDEYEAELEEIRSTGRAVNFRRTFDDEVGVCAVVTDHRGHPVAGVLIAAPAYRVDEQRCAELLERCTEAAALVSSRLGGSVGRN